MRTELEHSKQKRPLMEAAALVVFLGTIAYTWERTETFWNHGLHIYRGTGFAKPQCGFGYRYGNKGYIWIISFLFLLTD